MTHVKRARRASAPPCTRHASRFSKRLHERTIWRHVRSRDRPADELPSPSWQNESEHADPPSQNGLITTHSGVLPVGTRANIAGNTKPSYRGTQRLFVSVACLRRSNSSRQISTVTHLLEKARPPQGS